MVEIDLTPQGRALATKAPEAAKGRRLHGLRRLSPRQLRTVQRGVSALVEIMEADDLEARFFFSDDDRPARAASERAIGAAGSLGSS